MLKTRPSCHVNFVLGILAPSFSAKTNASGRGIMLVKSFKKGTAPDSALKFFGSLGVGFEPATSAVI